MCREWAVHEGVVWCYGQSSRRLQASTRHFGTEGAYGLSALHHLTPSIPPNTFSISHLSLRTFLVLSLTVLYTSFPHFPPRRPFPLCPTPPLSTLFPHIQCIKEPHLPLSYLQSQLEEFQLLLPALVECVDHVTSGRSQGPQILSYLHDQCSSGVPIIQSTFEK